MAPEFEVSDKFIRSKQMIVFLILTTIVSFLFYPVLNLRQKKSRELQESIKNSVRDRLESFGGTSLKRLE
jgi:hypothetical protein